MKTLQADNSLRLATLKQQIGELLQKTSVVSKTTLDNLKDDLMDEMSENYTRNEWRRCENTLETSGEDVKQHSKRVEKM